MSFPAANVAPDFFHMGKRTKQLPTTWRDTHHFKAKHRGAIAITLAPPSFFSYLRLRSSGASQGCTLSLEAQTSSKLSVHLAFHTLFLAVGEGCLGKHLHKKRDTEGERYNPITPWPFLGEVGRQCVTLDT